MYIHIGRGIYYPLIQPQKHMIKGGNNFYYIHSHSIFRICTTTRTNILLRGHSYYKSYYCHAIHSNYYYWMNLGGGGYSIRNATLNRFFSLHFILPFIILFLIILHVFFLHETGSKNPLGVNRNLYKIPFNIYFSLMIVALIYYVIYVLICCNNIYINTRY